MSAQADTSQGWYAGREDGGDGWKGGPYSWKELVSFAREGRVTPEDLVWHESLPDWIPAGSVPGLFAESAPMVSSPAPAAPVAPPAAPSPAPVYAPPAAPALAPTPATPAATATPPAPAAPTAPAPAAPAPAVPVPAPPASKPPKRRLGLILGVIGAVLGVALLGAGGWWAWSSGLFAGKPALGVATVTLPQRSALVTTKDYGEVPVNQVVVSLKDGGGRGDAERVAKALGGTIVGEIEYIQAYQISYPGTTEADLLAAIATAKSDAKVEYAFANEQVEVYIEFKGVRVDPYDDPMYGGGVGDGYKAAGVSKAWSYIKGSGISLNDTHVGIVDEGLYAPGEGRSSEFGGDVQMDFPDPAAGKVNAPAVSHGNVNKAGTHGTGVATIIGADAGNGGPSGIAAPLGKKLKISMINHNAGGYGDTVTAPDPNDPSKQTLADGKTYSFGSLVALKKEVEAGSKVINCSWGADVCSPDMAAAYKRFFEKMAADHPDVTFVCAAGNTGGPLDNRTSFPCGHNLPNMITVGAVDNDGTLADYSTTSGSNYVVDLAAPGTGAVVGTDPNGGPVRQDGTSFAAPHVTAAVAMLLSINPKLTAAEVKQILLDTARQGTTVGEPGTAGEKTNLAPPETGGKVLAIDAAVLAVINDVRAEKGLPELTPELLEKMGIIDAVASNDTPGEYVVRGTVEAMGEQGTNVSIQVTGEGYAIGGDTTQMIEAPGDVTWEVTLPKDEGTILVTRLDNGAASRITIENIDINGAWSGSFTVTDVTIEDQEAAEEEGCTLAFVDAMKGKAAPMTMDVTVDESGQGSGVTVIDYRGLIEGISAPEPQTLQLSYAGGVLTFQPGEGASMSATVRRQGDTVVMTGSMSSAGKGWSMRSVFTLTQPAK